MVERPGRRAVVTGVGVVSPFGTDLSACWQALLGGACATATVPWPLLDRLSGPQVGAVHLSGVPSVGERDAGTDVPRACRFAALAVRDAIDDARVVVGRHDTTSLVVGSVMDARPALEYLPAGAPPTSIERHVRAAVGLGGVGLTVATACAAGNSALALAARMVARGADAVVACGAEELSATVMMEFATFRALARRGARPFDRDRDGVVLGEGAVAVMVEPWQRARRRGATIYGEIAGWGESCDAFHMTAPRPDGTVAARAISGALRRSRVAPDDLALVNAHGTGTPHNDAAEARALHLALGDAASVVPTTSLKGAVGHLQGAAAMFEAVVTLLALRSGQVPPTVGCVAPDPAFGLDVVRGRPVGVTGEWAVNSAFGFGGINSCLVLRGAA